MRILAENHNGVFVRNKTDIPCLYWFDPVYKCNYRFYWNISPEALKEELKLDIGYDVDVSDFSDSAARFIPLYGKDHKVYTIWVRQAGNKTHFARMVAHECVHATASTMRDAGLELSEESEEAFSYHTEYLLTTIYNLRELYERRKRLVRQRNRAKANAGRGAAQTKGRSKGEEP